jgi:protein involved in polysaccharide export with SLBB domain
MIAPQVPGGCPVRQAVFDDEADGQGDDPVRVVAARRGEVRQVSAEVQPAAGAAVPGVGHVQVAGPVVEQAADVMQDAVAEVIAVAAAAAAWTGAPAVVARAADD